MAGTKYLKDNYTTENPFVDIIMANAKALAFSAIVKDQYTADEMETTESLKESEIYISCVEGHAELGLFEKIPHSFLVSVGVPKASIDQYERDYDQSYIPLNYHKPLEELMMKFYIENYDEKNEYYRMITGLPPHGDPGVPIRDYDYLIPDYITYTENFFHEESANVNKSFEIAGVLDVVRAEYPEYKYLNYLTQGISLYDARKKMDFSLLFYTDEGNYSLTKEFERKYEECRKFVLNTQYSLAYDIESPYYHSFMLAYCLLITVIDMLVEVQSHIVKKDVLDRRCIQYIFSMYEIPYYRTIPYKYQERMCKNVHNLVKYKSTDTELFSLMNLFGFEDIEIFKWFILKNRKTNAWGEFIHNTTTQKSCKVNDFIYQDTVEVKMNATQKRGPIPDDIQYMRKYMDNLNPSPSSSTQYIDKYIPFPFEYFLQKGNVMIVRLDNYILKESEYEIYDYNIIRFKNGIAYGKSKITFDFYYDKETIPANGFLVNTDDRVETYVVDGERVYGDDRKFDLSNTKLNEFFTDPDNQFNVILNNVWLSKNQYTVDYDKKTIRLANSIAVNKFDDIVKFVFIRPLKFKTVYDKRDVKVTGSATTNIAIPEPFTNYCANKNGFFVSINDQVIDQSRYTISGTTLVMSSALAVNTKVSFHFFYSNQASLTTLDLRESVETIRATENYQYNFPVHFPVKNFVTSGYKVYVKTLDWWLPDIFYTTIGQGTLTILERSICDPNPGREMELHYFYLPYDRNVYDNIVVTSSYVESKEDFQKKFPIKFPTNDFLAKGNKVVIDSEGVLLREGTDYTMTTPVGGQAVVTIPNRDYRPMKGMRLNYTFFYLDDSANRIGITSKSLGTVTQAAQEIELPFPFYPYLETKQGFILYIGDRILTHNDIRMVDKFHCKLPTTVDDVGSKIHIIFFYNDLYNTTGGVRTKFIVEWKQQYITDPFIIMDPPAEMYVENKWPYFVSYGNRLYLEETKYDVINHTLYTNPISDLMAHKYGYYLNFVYIYLLKEGYMSEDTVEVHSTNTDMHFAKAPISDLYQVQYIKDKANWRTYDSITNRDGWWDGLYYKNNAHEVIKDEIFKKPFNYERTKYYGISNTIDLGEYSAQISYFYSILYDDVFYENYVDILIPILSPSHRFKLAHLFIYMEVLTYIFNGFEDFIIDRPSKWMYVLGFNFKNDVNDLKEYLKEMKQHNSDFPIWDYINEDSELSDIVEFVNLFKENFKVRQTILKAMTRANDYREYSVWKKIYNSLLIWKLNMDYFKKSDGTPATTYTEFLKDKDTLLYESIMDIKSITDQETLEDTIINICDSIIYILEEYLDGDEFKHIFSTYPGHDPNKAAKYLYMMVDFFKSYKITLLDRTETMDINDPNDPDNYFQGIDQIETITESTLTADYMIPTETFNTKEHMELHEWIAVPDFTNQLIEYPYPSHHANDTPARPLDPTSNVRSLHVKGDYKVTPPDYDPVVTLTRIKDAGRWMKEDVSIELYGKNSIRFEFYPCKIKTNKLSFVYLLKSSMKYVKQLSVKTLNGKTKINKETFTKSIISGSTKIVRENVEILLPGVMELEGRLFLFGYKMMTVYAPIYTEMKEVPTADIPDLNDRIIDQRSSTLMTLEEMYKGSTKLEVVPPGLEYTNVEGMLYYNNFTDFCANCVNLKYFPFKTTYFHYDNDDNIFDRAFYNCTSLTKIDDFNLSEYAACECKTSFVQAFYNCMKLKYGIGLIGVTRDLNMTQAFYNCSSLTDPPTIRVMYNDLNLSQAFAKCSQMEFLPSIFFPCTNPLYGTTSTVNLSYTFDSCSSLSNPESKTGRAFIFSGTNVNATRTFNKCISLKKGIEFEFKDGCNANLDRTYVGCSALEHSSSMKVETNSEIHLTSTYKDCKALNYATMIVADNTSKVYLNRTFEGCSGLIFADNLIGPYGGDFYLDHTFKDCIGLTTVTLDCNRLKSWNGIFEGCTGLTEVTFTNTTPATEFSINHASLDGSSTLSYTIVYKP